MGKRMRASGLLKEPGTPERQAHALRMGDTPEDASSTETPGLKVRRYQITCMLSWLLKRGKITQSQFDAGIRWREDYYNSGSTQRVTSKFEPPVSGGQENWRACTLDARRRYENASKVLAPQPFQVCFALCMDDVRPVRMSVASNALDRLADHYGI
jgi:hypothetical protein